MPSIERALEPLPPPLRAEVMPRWEAYVRAAGDAGLAPVHDGALLAQLARVWAASDFVARSCGREPAMLEDLVASGDLATAYGAGAYLQRLEPFLEAVEDEAALGVALRRFRRREMVRIAWRDLGGLAGVEETLESLSDLAETVTDAALERLHRWQCQRHGVPRGRDASPQRMVVLGMGKLGGRELNYSSDIDLIFAFPEKGGTDGARALDNEQFFVRLGQRLINVLDNITAEGFVFRVDMRLRPFGDSGPLAASFAALETYYQSQGREWERYALIKARVVAGDREAGARLLEDLRPFIYRRYLDYGAFESLREMKVLVAREVERRGLRRNVKLGPGGIREIEFIGQAFQLIYGGREPALRERGILRVLDHLAADGRLPGYAVRGLKDAYAFLRRTENRLQAWADEQTHDLPEDEAGKRRLAFAMGFPGWEDFVAALMRRVQVVSQQFEQVFAAPQAAAPEAEQAGAYAALWHGATSPARAREILETGGFDDPDAALATVEGLQGSFSHRAMDQRGRERLNSLMPLVLGAVAAAPAPARTLERICRLLEAIARRSVYLALLVENPMALSQLVKLCAASPWIAEHLARYPLLLDELLDPASLYTPLQRGGLGAELDAMLARVPAEDTEQVLDVLRHFKQTNQLRVAAADISDAMPLMVVSDHLTEIAEAVLCRALDIVRGGLAERFGVPRCVTEDGPREAAFAIVAYGKLGGIELGYGSDLDLVFLHDSAGQAQHTEGPRSIENASFFAKLVQRLIHMLTAHTAAGVLYEVDTRLRPSGRSGLLVSSLAAMEAYQREQAWTWEHQALVRARVVAGPDHLVRAFEAIRHEVLCRERDPAALRQEVRDMRERMRAELGSSHPGLFHLKQDRGGIADIEFVVQYAILANAYCHPELITWTDNIRQLDALEDAGILPAADAQMLRGAYRTLRRRIHHLKLQGQSSLVPDPELRDLREAVAHLWGVLLGEE